MTHGDGFFEDLRGVENLDAARFPFFLPFHSEQSKSVELPPLRLYAHACRAHKVVNTLDDKVPSYFPCYFAGCAAQVIFACLSLQSVPLNNGAESRQEASAVLRSLNLPQHTGKCYTRRLADSINVSATLMTFLSVGKVHYNPL